MRRFVACLLAVVAVALLAACSSNGGGNRRVVQLVQTDDGCSPAQIAVQPGEKLSLQVRNDGKKDHEVEGIEGTKVGEVTVPSGRTRSVNYDAPNKTAVQKVKCYIPNGSTTIVELNVGGQPGAPAVTPRPTP